MMAVLRKSRAASTRDASTDSELVSKMTTILAARRMALAAKLIAMAIETTLLSSSGSSSSCRGGCCELSRFAIRGVASSGTL